jgi:AraC-like DNA-binding protein
MPQIELYENKSVLDTELPVQIEMSSEGFRKHWHEHLELHYITEGKADFHLGQSTYNVVPGDLVIINPSELHAIYATQKPYHARVIIFDIADIAQELASCNYIFAPIIKDDPTIGDLSQRIFSEMQEARLGWKQQCKALVLELLVYLCRNCVVQSLQLRESVRRRKNLDRLNLVLCYIEANYCQDISVMQLANMVYLSEDRFAHLFRESIGIAPIQFINDLRLKKALTLLRMQEYTATEVAEIVGFRDYNNFERQFRKRFGCTPKDVKSGRFIPDEENSGIV